MSPGLMSSMQYNNFVGLHPFASLGALTQPNAQQLYQQATLQNILMQQLGAGQPINRQQPNIQNMVAGQGNGANPFGGAMPPMPNIPKQMFNFAANQV